VRAFEQRFGSAPDPAAALAYDAVMLLTHAMRQAGTTAPSIVADTLHHVRAWPGVTGQFTLDSGGYLIGRRMVKVVVRHGRLEYLDEQTLGYNPRIAGPPSEHLAVPIPRSAAALAYLGVSRLCDRAVDWRELLDAVFHSSVREDA
jgi:hypothetical protein